MTIVASRLHEEWSDTMTTTIKLTPKVIFHAYAAGTTPREEMIERIATYPFAKRPNTDGYDWLTGAADGPTWMEVSLAETKKFITPEDYAEIFERKNAAR